jgi:hypothetical protein
LELSSDSSVKINFDIQLLVDCNSRGPSQSNRHTWAAKTFIRLARQIDQYRRSRESDPSTRNQPHDQDNHGDNEHKVNQTTTNVADESQQPKDQEYD